MRELRNKTQGRDNLRLCSSNEHTYADLLGGQCAAGFVISDLYEDVMSDSPLGKYHPNYIATRAVKM